MPPEFLLDMQNLQEKFVLHQAFDDMLPQATRKEHKHPFLAPSWKGLSRTREGKELFGHYLSRKDLEARGMCNAESIHRLRQVWRLLPTDTVAHRKLDVVMGTMISLQIMHDTFVANRPASDPNYPMIDMTPVAVPPA